MCVENTKKVLNLGLLITPLMFVAGQYINEIMACLSTNALDQSVVVVVSTDRWAVATTLRM